MAGDNQPESQPLQRALLSQPGCPACRSAGIAEQRAMRWFLRESYNEAATLRLLPASGACPRHAAHMLGGDNDHLTLSFEFLVKSRLAGPGGLARRPLVRRGRAKATDPRPCFICSAGAHSAGVAVIDVLGLLDSDYGRTAYLKHDGLCLQHHEQAKSQAAPETAAWLEAQLRPRLESMLELFELYHRHRDVRFKHEPKGDEQQAWRHALRFFWGDVEVLLESDQYEAWDSGR